MAFMQDFENIVGLVNAIDTGKTDRLYDSLAQMIEASAAKGLAEAKDTMGEDFKDFIAQPRAVIRNKREQQRNAHEAAMQAEELKLKKLEVLARAKALDLDTED